MDAREITREAMKSASVGLAGRDGEKRSLEYYASVGIDHFGHDHDNLALLFEEATDAILAALKEEGYAVVEVKPALEPVWIQNLCGFIDGTFIPLDDGWQGIWKLRVRALAAAQEQEEG